jgi:hypothetical protein
MAPMHFQLLVGLCCLRHEPDAVEMTIGDRVWDSDAESHRDVDVTIVVSETEGKRTGFVGYDAKMERLNVDEVEQLCTKLNDMPDLTTRAIVSAYGYSDTAIRKAAKKGVNLFEFRDWTENVKSGFPKATLDGAASESLFCSSTAFRWVGVPQLKFNPGDPNREDYLSDLTGETKLLRANGQPHTKHPTIQALVNALLPFLANELSGERAAQAILGAPIPYPPNLRPEGPMGEPIQFPIVVCPIVDPTFFSINGTLRQLKAVHVAGSLQWHYSRVSAEYKILVELSTQQVYAGAAIAIHPGHSGKLMAATLAPDNSLMEVRLICLTPKQQNFIHRLKVPV